MTHLYFTTPNTYIGKLLVLCCFLLFIHPTFAATYKVEIDFHHPSLKHTDTKSEIHLIYVDDQGNTIHTEKASGIYPISQAARTFSYSSDKAVQFIVIKTSGSDAFFIDQLKIWKDGQLLQTHEQDGGMGWCLSTDVGDSKGVWASSLKGDCHAGRIFLVENQMNDANPLGAQRLSSTKPARQLKGSEEGWVYHHNELRNEINAEGLGRCYDIRYIDPINWSNETIRAGLRASVVDLARDDSKRPARHNNKDYVVPKGVVFTSEIIGDTEAESKFAATSFEYENEVLSSYRAKIGVPKCGSAKFSAAFKDVSRDVGSNSSLYAFSKMYKQFYKLDLYFDDPDHQHYINARFWEGVKSLGQGLSALEFIKKFGTHYAASTYYGGNFFQRRTVSQTAYAYYESNENEFKADISGTIKKVNFDVGTTQGSKNDRGETEQVKMSSAKIYTIGGDLNQYRPDLWAKSVLNNLAVVNVRLVRISTLLTSKNFPNIPNIQEKQALLSKAIVFAEQESQLLQSTKQNHKFFTKQAATFKLTVTHIKCRGHGAKETGGNSEYFGSVKMGMFNRNGKSLKSSTFFKRDDKKHLSLALNQSYDINKSITYKIGAADIAKGYVSIYGSLKEKDFTDIPLSTISHHSEKSKIYFRTALDHEVKKNLVFTSKYGDKVVIYYKLLKL